MYLRWYGPVQVRRVFLSRVTGTLRRLLFVSVSVFQYHVNGRNLQRHLQL